MRNEESILTIDKCENKRWTNRSGELHRTDGPALEFSNGTKEWYQNGKLHRTDGPAIEYINGTKYWYQNGKRHRIGGPAIQWNNGNKSWYIKDFSFSNKEKYFNALTDKEKAIALFSEDFHNG